MVRGFATWLHNLDPAVEIPPTDVLAFQARRAVPYLYSPADITALMDAAATLKGRLRQATYRTLIGLLAVTGMRVGEARRLDRVDVDLKQGTLAVRHTKFDKSRLLPLHPSTTQALSDYLNLRDRLAPPDASTTVFISPRGKPLIACNVESIFRILVARAGPEPRGAARPRMHDLRHSFIVAAVLDGYQRGLDVQARLAAIATYAGHDDPKASYWYLTASPELMAIAGERLDTYLEAAR
ncbi:MAG: tyrosine-type recombinase/integrase [Actinomycetota bacterium]|nr:tyrosine-type recombinase/integrase [Actinomycetota bacterium]